MPCLARQSGLQQIRTCACFGIQRLRCLLLRWHHFGACHFSHPLQNTARRNSAVGCQHVDASGTSDSAGAPPFLFGIAACLAVDSLRRPVSKLKDQVLSSNYPDRGNQQGARRATFPVHSGVNAEKLACCLWVVLQRLPGLGLRLPKPLLTPAFCACYNALAVVTTSRPKGLVAVPAQRGTHNICNGSGVCRASLKQEGKYINE